MVWLLKLKYGETIKLCLMDTDTYTVFIKTDGIYQNIAENVETRFDSSNYESDRPLPKGKNKKSNWINERWVRWKNNDRICWIKSKNLKSLSRSQ